MEYIPRKEMPQIEPKDVPHLIVDSWRLPHKPTIETVSPKTLHPHQRIDRQRARTMPVSIRVSPVIISLDNYILDGNHRWYANKYHRVSAMAVIRIGLEFNSALDYLLSLPFVTTERRLPEHDYQSK